MEKNSLEMNILESIPVDASEDRCFDGVLMYVGTHRSAQKHDLQSLTEVVWALHVDRMTAWMK